MVIRIRPISRQDTTERLGQILDLAMLANPWAKRSKYKEFLLSLFHDFDHLAFVAVDGGKIAGYVMGDTKRNEGEIEDIAVLPDYRGKGLGRWLMQAELKAMGELRVKRVILWVHWRNSEAIPFYYRLGFRLLRCVRDLTGPGQDAVYLEKKL
jgi:ribosomal protein S18 acetylase RimI-like enzyme